MSEQRDIGPLQPIAMEALATWRRWQKYTALERDEITAMLATLIRIDLARDARAKQDAAQRASVHQFVSPVYDMPRGRVADE